MRGRRSGSGPSTVTGPEGSALYDPGCQQGQPLVWVDFNPSVSGKWGSLKRILHRSNRAAVTIEGTMRGGEPTKIDPKLPEQIKEALKNQKERYGHLGGFDMAIEVSRIIEAKPVK